MRGEELWMEQVNAVFHNVLNLGQGGADPLVYGLGLFVIVMALTVFSKVRADGGLSFFPEQEPDGLNPESLNFKVNQEAIDRLRDPSLPPVGKKFANPAERERWLQGTVKSRTDPSELDSIAQLFECEGVLHECSGADLKTEQDLQELAELGYEVQSLDSLNLPKFRGLLLEDFLGRVVRVWSPSPVCRFATERMDASPSQLARFTKTLLNLHQLGLRVETLPVWLFLQQEEGEFFIPHIPQVRRHRFPCNLQKELMAHRVWGEFPGHLFDSKNDNLSHQTFQFSFASFAWRLLADAWPYDREPLRSVRGESPNRVDHDFGESLTPILRRMTSLEPRDRYDDLGTALKELTEALARVA